MKLRYIAIMAILSTSAAFASEGTCFVQKKLTELGYYQGGIDCDWGPNTERALRRFQRENGLSVDGVAGSDTMKALRQSGGRGDVNYESYAGPRVRNQVDQRPLRNCKRDVISEVGAGRWTESMARTSALKNWQRSVRFRYGEIWTNHANAEEANIRCTPSSVGAVVTTYRCEISGIPCLAGN